MADDFAQSSARNHQLSMAGSDGKSRFLHLLPDAPGLFTDRQGLFGAYTKWSNKQPAKFSQWIASGREDFRNALRGKPEDVMGTAVHMFGAERAAAAFSGGTHDYNPRHQFEGSTISAGHEISAPRTLDVTHGGGVGMSL